MSIVEKFRNGFMAIKQNGGLWRSVLQFYRIDDVKDGDYIGTDRNGNRYYQNNRYFVGRSRWVIYNEKYGMDYDGSQIDPEWHPWLHYTTDQPPTVAKPVNYKWISQKPEQNNTGLPGQYVPYPTTGPKIEAWVPNQNAAKKDH